MKQKSLKANTNLIKVAYNVTITALQTKPQTILGLNL